MKNEAQKREEKKRNKTLCSKSLQAVCDFSNLQKCITLYKLTS